jgi:hypothetical protein
MRQVLDNHAPLKTRSVPVRPSAPWIGEEIREAKNALRRAEKVANHTKLTVHREMFVYHRKLLKGLHRSAKKEHYIKKLADCTSAKLFYGVADDLLGRKTEPQLPNNIPATDIPNAFACFMHDKIANIRRELDSRSVPVTYDPFHGTSLTCFAPVSEDFVRKLISQSQSKSCSLDPVPTSLLKSCLDDLTPVITRVINHSLLTGSVPPCFKHALVTPLLKKTSLDKNALKNYRPVSNLPYLSKLLERVVLHQLVEHVTKNDLLEQKQSAYRQYHSTETALLHVTNCLLSSVDQGQVSILTLLDLSAAFDTIDHDILLMRLSTTFGVSDSALQWLRSYITDRFMTFTVNNITSAPKRLDFGVPQGSVLGPLLFVLYTHPLSQIVLDSGLDLHKFSDDTQLFNSAPPADFDLVSRQTERCVLRVRCWMESNKLKLNDEKTEAMVVGSRSRTSVLDTGHLAIGGSSISFQPKVRDLGVVLDARLTMKDHISSVCRSAYLELRRIASVRPFLTTEATAELTRSRILSKIDYCNSLLAGITSEQIARLQKIQNHAARLTFRKKRHDHVTPLLKKLHWLPVAERIDFKLATISFRYFDGTLPPYLSCCLSSYSPLRTLRSSSQKLLTIPRVNLKSAGARSFQYQAPLIWNSLPLEVRLSVSLSSFKTQLKTHLFRIAFP